MQQNQSVDDVMASVSFSGYGRAFQEKVIQAFIVDHRWAAQMADVFRSEYFELEHLRFLSDQIFTYYNSYKTFPSFDCLIPLVRDALQGTGNETLTRMVVDFLGETRKGPDLGDLPWVKDKALDFCRKQEIKLTMERIVDKVEDSKYDEIVDELKRAVSRGACESVGHEFKLDREARFVEAERHPVATPWPELNHNHYLRGGLGRGELGCVCAATGVGKSHALVDLGTQALLDRKNVVHYTCELSENSVGIRYDSRLTEIPSNEIVLHKKEVLQIEDGLKLGKLYIKGYSAGAASISTLRSHLERLMLQNFVPDLVIIDYADLLRSARRYDSPRFELKLIYEELRALATDLNIPVWTASQSNKEGANSDIVGLENMGEAYAKAATCDVVIGLSRKPEEKASGCGRLFLAKNRAGRDGINWPIRIDTACSKISLSDEPLDGTEFKQQAERDVKAKLRAKYDELHHAQFPIKELERHTYPIVKLP